jgi:glutamyl-tRNA(Gln) amidotransferase subunit D
MLPETAYIKLSWILRRTRELGEVRRLMLTILLVRLAQDIT